MSGEPSEQGGVQRRFIGYIIALVIGLVAAGIYAISHWETGPFGRSQFVDLKPEQEMQLGLQAYQEILSKSDVVKPGDPRYGKALEVVEKITERLVQTIKTSEAFLETSGLKKYQSRFADFQWEVRLVRDDQVNAFCLPGGKMVVYTGILPVCQNDAALATVMGHEISHALGRHGAERMAHQKMAQIGLGAAGATLPGDRQERDRVIGLMSAGAKLGILKYGRDHESEADRMGLYLMAAAGYDPTESVRFWERMQQSSKGGSPPEFMSTHPSHKTRIDDLNRWMPEAMKLYNASPLKTRTTRLPLPR